MAVFFNLNYVSYVSLYVECSNDKYRNTLCFITGVMYDLISGPLLILLSFVIHDWRFVHVATGVFLLSFSLSHFLWLQESPRWLVAKGRYEEALRVVRQAIIINTGHKQKAEEITVADLKMLPTTGTRTRRVYVALCSDWMDLFRTPGNLCILLPLMWIWTSITHDDLLQRGLFRNAS